MDFHCIIVYDSDLWIKYIIQKLSFGNHFVENTQSKISYHL